MVARRALAAPRPLSTPPILWSGSSLTCGAAHARGRACRDTEDDARGARRSTRPHQGDHKPSRIQLHRHSADGVHARDHDAVASVLRRYGDRAHALLSSLLEAGETLDKDFNAGDILLFSLAVSWFAGTCAAVKALP